MRADAGGLAPCAPSRSSRPADHPSRRWNEGLELARACAVILVVYSHGEALLDREALWAWFSSHLGLESFFKPGWWGVRIFFALSGYLIGRQVIDILHSCQLRSAFFFGLRRWVRTVPTYWMVLGLVCLWKGVSWFSPTAITNALFLQSAIPGQKSTELIEVAWSLVIEEWSYVLLTCLVVLFALARLKLTPQQAGRLIILMALAITACSAVSRYWAGCNPWISWEIMKKTSILQLDSLAAGLALAGVETLKPRLFRTLTRTRAWMGAMTIVLMSLVGWWLNGHFSSQSNATALDWALLGVIGYPLSSFLSCGFLAWLWNVKTSAWSPIAKAPIQLLSSTSYSLYLVHLSVPALMSRTWSDMGGGVAFALYMLISIGLGYLSWLVLEKPFLALRRVLHGQERASVAMNGSGSQA